jgi:hypothetical protein
VVQGCAALPVPASVGDCTCVKNKKKSNVNILRFHVWLRAGIGVADSILNLLEKRLNWVLEDDWGCHLILILCELRWVDEAISLLQVHEDL